MLCVRTNCQDSACRRIHEEPETHSGEQRLRLIEGLEWSYDGPGTRCPVCSERMHWHNLQPCVTPSWMECEDCQILCNVEIEQCFWYGDVTDEQFEAIREYWLERSSLMEVQ